ncbi:MAG: hypothetical protein KUG74_13310 [Rhodobacteraceae bacterium]|nr:hypothetical protein [Paracoccaceae bacterium]
MQLRVQLLSLATVALLGGVGVAQAQFIAGVNSEQRPVDAPVITQFVKDSDWYTRALTGVEAPYPSSLQFLEDQGAWFNPFTRPGMPGPYDIRGWHASE